MRAFSFLRQQAKRKVASWLRGLLRHYNAQERAELLRPLINPHDLLSCMSVEERLKVLATAARFLDINSVSAVGNLGVFEGSVDDESVHGRYIIEKNWAGGLNTILVDQVFKDQAGTYIDIGANIGLTLIPVAARTRASCIGFEPDPQSYLFLRKNLVANSLESKVATHQIALFSEDTTLQFERGKWNAGDNRVRTELPDQSPHDEYAEGKRDTTTVVARRLDGVLDISGAPRPIVCKVDTQGAEVHVYRGGRRFFGSLDLLVIEFWPYGLARLGTTPHDFLEITNCFRVGQFVALDGQDGGCEPTRWEPISDIQRRVLAIGKDLSGPNYVDLILAREPLPVSISTGRR